MPSAEAANRAAAADVMRASAVGSAAVGADSPPEIDPPEIHPPEIQADTRPPRPTKPDPDRVRLCIVKRAELPPAALIRFVCGPDDRMIPDLARRLPGRGVWVSATLEAVETAVKRGLFAKSLKRPVKADKDLGAHVEKLLAQDARQVLSLANKAGLITTGFAKVEIALEKGTAAALIAASDASADGAGKLARKFRAIRGAAHRDAPVLDDFTSAELGLAFGGSNVIHAAIAAGALGRRAIASCERLRTYRSNLKDVPAPGSAAQGPAAQGPEAQGPATDQPEATSTGMQSSISEPTAGQSAARDAARQDEQRQRQQRRPNSQRP